MKSTFNYTSRAGHVLSQQLQLAWQIMVVALAALLFTGNVQAQDTSDFCDGGPAEWPGLVNSGTANADLTDLYNSDSDTQFTQGSKDGNELSLNHWNKGLVNDKGDIINAGAKLVDGCYLRFFADRYAVNGDAAIGFWFYQDPNVSLNSDGSFSGEHMDGDLLIIVNFKKGGGTSDPIIYQWEGDGVVLVDGDVDACGISNTSEMDVPDGFDYTSKFGPAGKYQKGAFFEGYVNLCDIEGIDICFSKFLVETRNSQSIDASLQDLSFGDIDISPAQPLATATDITCNDEESTITVDSPIVGYTYVFDGPGIGDPIRVTYTDDESDLTFTAGEAGTYTLIAENESECQSEPYEVEVDSDLTPAGIPGVGDEERCGSGTVTFTVESPLEGVTYNWYDDDATDAEPVKTGTSFTTNSLSETTSFWVTATGANGCESARREIQAIIYPPIEVDAGGPDTRCQSTEAQVISLTGASISEDLSGTWSLYSSDPALTSAIITNNTLAAGSVTIPADYTGEIVLRLTSADPDGPCTEAYADRTITIGPAAIVDAGGPDTRCQSADAQMIDLTGASVKGGASTGTWSIVSADPANEGIVLEDNTLADGSLTVAANYYGVITLRLTSADPDGDGPCEAATDDRIVTIYQNPSVMVTASPSTCINNVPTVTITAAASGGSGTGYTYDWTVPEGATDPGDVSSFSATVAGTYSVVVTDSRECTVSGSVEPVFTPCEMPEGCTLGYWKNHPDSWCDTYHPEDRYGNIFTSAPGELADLTLMEALNLQGGGVYNLVRQSVAALLNACHSEVNYEISDPERVIELVNEAFQSQNPGAFASELDSYNNAGCPIDAHNNPIELPSTNTSSLEGVQADRISAYPTPFSDKATIEFTISKTENYVVNLYDMKGALVKQLKAGTAKAGELQLVEVDGTGLNEGLYIARMISDSGARSVKLLLKRE